ncbi:MAG: tol-pal system protein YbgF [Rhizomicrobium sp.]|jgi:tol-pal system protein YbgF
MMGRLTSTAAAFVLVSAFAGAAGATQTAYDAPARAQSRGVQLAGLFGESDEEKAARLREDNQDAQIANLTQRIHDLEQSLQQLTGQNEQLGHRVQELREKLDSQQKDYDYKLCSLSAQLLGAGTAPDQSGGALPCNLGATAGVAPAGPATFGSGGTLGTLPQGTAPDTRPQFDAALNLLAKAQYDEARAAFRTFVDNNPKDPLASQAVYWVGDIAYVQKDYGAAAQAFAEEIKKYPKSPRGPDSMLKLGQSLLALGQQKEGCSALGAIKSKYPHASASVLSQAATARATACR